MNKKLTYFIRSFMRISTIVVLLMSLGAGLTQAEKGHAQRLSDYTLNLAIGDETLDAVLTTIAERTRLSFAYDRESLREVKVKPANYRNTRLDHALQQILAKTGYRYEVINNNIVVSKKPIPKPQKPGKVTGQVTASETGQPLVGVTIQASPSRKSTITDEQGNYTLELMPGTYRLYARYVGYEQQAETTAIVKDSESTALDITMKSTMSELDEVVVIGYGEVRRGDLTGAVGSVEMSDFQKAPVRSFDEALAGRVSGVRVSGNDGQPGASNNIIIRGGNSLTQDNSPLYVIDGFPIESPDLNAIANQDIASIEVLKDASATAIYGARGSNGVVLITTKMGVEGPPTIEYDVFAGIQQNRRFIDMLSPYEFVKYQLELDNERATKLYLTDRSLDDYRGMVGLDMQDQLYRTAPMQNHNFSVRGGTKGTTYAFSANIIDQQGVVVNSGFERLQGRLALGQQLNEKLKFYINANYSRNMSHGSVVSAPTGGIASVALIYNAMGYRPVAGRSGVDLAYELFDPDIDPASADYRVNPVISAENEVNRRINNNLALTSYLQYQFTEKLNLKVSGGTTLRKLNRETFHNSKTQQGNPRGFPTSRGINGSLYENTTNNWVNENILTYRDKREHGDLTILGGVTFQGNKRSRFGYHASFMTNDKLGIDGLDESTSITPDRRSGNWTLMSGLVRVNYNFKKKYLLTGSFRADGSSKFPSNKWGYFPSFAAAWSMGNERFMDGLPAVSESKLRVGYGLTGNNRVGDFDYYPTLNFNYFNFYSFNNQTPQRGANLTSVGNPNLRWESTRQLNIGYDLGLWDQRLSLTVDLYKKTTDDLLLRAQLPYTTGYLSAVRNIGRVSNKGLEITLSTYNVRNKQFTWRTDFNIAFNRNKVLSLTDGQEELFSTVSFVGAFNSQNLYRAKVGEPVGMLFGTVSDGIYQYDDFDKQDDGSYLLKEDITGNGSARASIQPGDIKFQDLNGDGTITADDYTVLGRTLPLHIGGLSNTFTYKGVDLNVFLQWSYGNDIVNGNRVYFEQNPYNYVNFNQYATVADRWSPENPSNEIPRAGGIKPKYYHSGMIEDGSFLRIKTVSLGYTFNNTLLAPLRIKGLRVNASAQNLFTFTNYSGSDPEVSVRNSPLTPGFDFSAYPRAFTVTFGVNVSF